VLLRDFSNGKSSYDRNPETAISSCIDECVEELVAAQTTLALAKLLKALPLLTDKILVKTLSDWLDIRGRDRSGLQRLGPGRGESQSFQTSI